MKFCKKESIPALFLYYNISNLFVIITNKIGTRFDTETLKIGIFTLNKFSVTNETLQKYFV